jgi:hypothetical protein
LALYYFAKNAVWVVHDEYYIQLRSEKWF